MTSILQFFNQVRLELSKVEWPTYQEFIGSTVVVLFLMFIFAVYMGVVDKVIFYLIHPVYSYASY